MECLPLAGLSHLRTGLGGGDEDGRDARMSMEVHVIWQGQLTGENRAIGV